MRTSASTDADVCVDRCGRLRRPMRMSASTDADVCADRCACLRRPMRMAIVHELVRRVCRNYITAKNLKSATALIR
ncbi:hypothetical protein [Leyella stercorea]|uniref:hypothetical protein n=1 Tax=Leyella stercorea TaxID=363265 RepID=UPI003AEFE2C7